MELAACAGAYSGTCPAHLVVLAMHDKMQHDEVMAVAGGLHMEQEAVDEVLHKSPDEHAQHEEAYEHRLRHHHGIICSGERWSGLMNAMHTCVGWRQSPSLVTQANLGVVALCLVAVGRPHQKALW